MCSEQLDQKQEQVLIIINDKYYFAHAQLQSSEKKQANKQTNKSLAIIYYGYSSLYKFSTKAIRRTAGCWS